MARSLATDTVALFVGAGVPASLGVPDWKGLLHRIAAAFFTHWELDIESGSASATVPPTVTIALWDEAFWTDSALEAARAVSADDALLLAQQIRNCMDEHNWQYLLRKLIYDDDGWEVDDILASSPLIASLVALAKRFKPAAIINYNFDDLLDRALNHSGQEFTPVWKHRAMPPGRKPVVHPHGYLPFAGGPFVTVVIGESEYQQEASEPYSWSNLVQLQYLVTHTCVFVGHSLTDPNLRRLLRIASTVPQHHKRYAFLPFPNDADHVTMLRRTLFDNDLRRLGVTPIRFPAGAASAPDFSVLPTLLALVANDRAQDYSFWCGA